MNYIDLHTHTNISDGLLTPKELIKKASEYGLKAIAICDHDTLGAYDEKSIFNYSKELGVELVSAVEFSSVDEEHNKYHILGLLLDVDNQELRSFVDLIQKERISYAHKVSKILKHNGWKIDLSVYIQKGESITKAHVSRSILSQMQNHTKLVELFGKIPSEGEFIENFLIKGKDYFVESSKVTPSSAIDIIHKAGGLAILAHPSFNVMKGENFEDLCEKFKNMGIDGFEAINIQFDKSNNDVRFDMVDKFVKFANDNNLLITGGSDYHHSNSALIGNFIDLGFMNDQYKVSYDILNKLKQYKKIQYGI